jgi:uncharacterized membrane protein (UPF0127 family)
MRARAIALATLPIAIALIATFAFTRTTDAPRYATSIPIRIGNSVVSAELATTSAARELGLSARDGLAPDTGMLFVFPRDGAYSFWMKGMRFSIDILWLDASGRVVTVHERVSPDTYPAAFSSSAPARYVLELPAGYAQQHRISPGKQLILPMLGDSE